jgi:DNA-binding NarL/FixJ family response regulator
VLKAIAGACAHQEAGTVFNVGPNTIAPHRSRIIKKLHIKHITEFAGHALELKLICTGPVLKFLGLHGIAAF